MESVARGRVGGEGERTVELARERSAGAELGADQVEMQAGSWNAEIPAEGAAEASLALVIRKFAVGLLDGEPSGEAEIGEVGEGVGGRAIEVGAELDHGVVQDFDARTGGFVVGAEALGVDAGKGLWDGGSAILEAEWAGGVGLLADRGGQQEFVVVGENHGAFTAVALLPDQSGEGGELLAKPVGFGGQFEAPTEFVVPQGRFKDADELGAAELVEPDGAGRAEHLLEALARGGNAGRHFGGEGVDRDRQSFQQG